LENDLTKDNTDDEKNEFKLERCHGRFGKFLYFLFEVTGTIYWIFVELCVEFSCDRLEMYRAET